MAFCFVDFVEKTKPEILIDWRWRTDRLVDIVVAEVDVVAGGVFFWFNLFG